jgi:hypothetical protein
VTEALHPDAQNEGVTEGVKSCAHQNCAAHFLSDASTDHEAALSQPHEKKRNGKGEEKGYDDVA